MLFTHNGTLLEEVFIAQDIGFPVQSANLVIELSKLREFLTDS
jgi:hypothetical protein